MRLEFEAIGTRWEIDVPHLPGSVSESELSQAVHARIALFDKTYSRFRKDSWVSNIRSPGSYELPPDAPPLFDLYHELYRITDGACTPLIGQALEQAGYDAEYSLIPKRVEAVPAWAESIEIHGNMFEVKKPSVLDFGGAGKGYLVDIVGALMQQLGITSFYVDAGGDILYKGDIVLDIGLEHPERSDEVIGVAHLAGGSICGSSGNRRKWKEYHHIINPHTRTSPTGKRAIWVVQDSALLADGLATALFFTEAPLLLSRFAFEYVVVYEDYSIEKSNNFPGDFFIKK